MESAVDRRTWLQAAAVCALEASGLGRLTFPLPQLPDEVPVPFADTGQFRRMVRESNPEVRPMDLRRLTSRKTPVDDFFVFHQTVAPDIDPDRWRLRVSGQVERPLSLSLRELQSLASGQSPVEAVIECSGNSYAKEAMSGLVGNAEWSGVRLADVLKRAGLRPEAREVVFFGADGERDPATGYTLFHGRSLFVQDAAHPDALLALTMNGEPLTRQHGFPLRLILPGWYGMTQIKWLSHIEILDRRFEGAPMSRNYHSLLAVDAGGPGRLMVESSITHMRLKSVVARVTQRADRFRIYGAAWGGRVAIARVEVRIDDGGWHAAEFIESRPPYGWILWVAELPATGSGRHTVVSRAIDQQGRIQPTLDELWEELKSARENHAQWVREIEVP